MGSKQQIKRLSSWTIILLLFSALWSGCRNELILNGKKFSETEAQDLVSSFIDACQKEDFKKAAEFWSIDTKDNFYPNFEDYCKKIGGSEWKIGKIGKGKKLVRFIKIERLGGASEHRFFYFNEIGGKLYLHKTPIRIL